MLASTQMFLNHDLHLSDSEFCDKLCEVLSDQQIEQIVCYGIGRLGSCKQAQYQFAVLVNVLQKSPNVQKLVVFILRFYSCEL